MQHVLYYTLRMHTAETLVRAHVRLHDAFSDEKRHGQRMEVQRTCQKVRACLLLHSRRHAPPRQGSGFRV